MFLKIRNIIWFFFIFFGAKANAQFYLEPHTGFVVGSFYQDLKSINGYDAPRAKTYNYDNRTVKGNIGAFGFGTKIGYKLSFFFTALDLQYQTGSFYKIGIAAGRQFGGSRDHLFTFQDVRADMTNLSSALIVGIDVPYVPRLWIGYNFYDYLKLQDIASMDEFHGRGPRFGIGFGSTFSFNVEYSLTTYNDRDGFSLPGVTEKGSLTYEERELETSKFYLNFSYFFNL